MGLKLASTLAVMFLFALMYAVVFVIGIWFLPSNFLGLLLMIAFTVGIVLLQYGISPLIVGWIYKIDTSRRSPPCPPKLAEKLDERNPSWEDPILPR